MCGRFVLSKNELVQKKHQIKISPSYNVSPSTDVLVLKPEPAFMRWSYSPKWKDDMNLINCRHETLLKKPSFRGSLRCVFISNGWYEWQRQENIKTPYFHFLPDNLLYFAGIYNLSSGCAVVTCESANNISHIHHRQPLLLDENQINEWISGKHEISRILDDQLSFYQVSKRVNSPKNNDKELLYKI